MYRRVLKSIRDFRNYLCFVEAKHLLFGKNIPSFPDNATKFG